MSYGAEPPAIDISEDDGDEVSGEESKGLKRWSEEETKKFVFALMGPDGCWERYLKSPTNILKKVRILVSNKGFFMSNSILRLQRKIFLGALITRL